MNYNADLIQFLQTVAGYTISGDTSEQKMFILFGSGANGKSTFLNAIAHILGDYSMTAQKNYQDWCDDNDVRFASKAYLKKSATKVYSSSLRSRFAANF
jgi:phage/plasmid-associated DNA primase